MPRTSRLAPCCKKPRPCLGWPGASATQAYWGEARDVPSATKGLLPLQDLKGHLDFGVSRKPPAFFLARLRDPFIDVVPVNLHDCPIYRDHLSPPGRCSTRTGGQLPSSNRGMVRLLGHQGDGYLGQLISQGIVQRRMPHQEAVPKGSEDQVHYQPRVKAAGPPSALQQICQERLAAVDEDGRMSPPSSQTRPLRMYCGWACWSLGPPTLMENWSSTAKSFLGNEAFAERPAPRLLCNHGGCFPLQAL